MNVMGAYLPRFVEEVRLYFLENGVHDIIDCAGITLEQMEIGDPTYPVKLIGDIYSNLELDGFESKGMIDFESPQTIVHDLICATVRQIFYDEEFVPGLGEPSPMKDMDMERRAAVHLALRAVPSG